MMSAFMQPQPSPFAGDPLQGTALASHLLLPLGPPAPLTAPTPNIFLGGAPC